MKINNEDRKGTKNQKPVSFCIFVGFITLFLPFFYWSGAMDQTLMPRLLALCIFLLCFTIPYFSTGMFRKLDFSILRHLLFPVLTGYFLVTLVSMSFALNYKESIYDIVKTFVFISLVALGTMIFLNTCCWEEQLSKFVIISGLIACSVGFTQYFTRVIMTHGEFLSDGRPVIYAVDGIMSHKNLFSISLLMMVPFTGYGIYCLKGNWKTASIGLFFLIFILIILLKTRSVWLGLGISIVITLVIQILWPEKFNINRRWRIIMIAGIISILSAFAGVIGFARHHGENSTLGYLLSITDTRNTLNTGRLKTWSLTTEMIKDHFFTGVGAGNWQINAPGYYKGRFSGNDPQNWIRPHNDFLWVMAEKGIAGLLIFLLVFVVIMYYLFIVVKKAERKYSILALFLISGIIGYMIVSFFDFPLERPFHQAFLALYLASSVAMFHRIKQVKPFSFNRIFVLVPFITLVTFGVVFSYSAARQEVFIRKARISLDRKDWHTMLHYALEAESPLKNMDPLENPVALFVGKACSELNDLPAAYKAFSEAIKAYPDNVNAIENLAEVDEKLKFYPEAEELLHRGLKLYPGDPELKEMLIDVYYLSGAYIKAYITLMSINGWEKDTTLCVNMKAIENQLGIPNGPPVASDTVAYSFAESARYYSYRIMQDPAWMELIRKKAARRGKSLQEMIRMDAEYMAGLPVSYFHTKIIRDAAWVEMIRRKAIQQNKPLDEMIRLDAEYMVSQRFSYYRSKIAGDTAEIKKVIMKAMLIKKSLVETIRYEAAYMLDQEIKDREKAGNAGG